MVPALKAIYCATDAEAGRAALDNFEFGTGLSGILCVRPVGTVRNLVREAGFIIDP